MQSNLNKTPCILTLPSRLITLLQKGFIVGLLALSLLVCGCASSSSPTEPGNEEGNASVTDAGQRGDRTSSPETTETTERGVLRCNGAEELCGREFNKIAYATTHNAMSNSVEGWLPPNQSVPITDQLQDGVRGLMLDIHLHEKLPYLCHSNCDLGKKKLTDGLQEITDFLKKNPNEVVTLILECYVDAKDVRQAFEESGLLSMTYAHPEGERWPTLRTMIEKNQRVVVLTDRGGGTYPWYHNMWKTAWDTRWKNSSTQDFTCKPDRGNSSNPLWILNHFLGNPLSTPKLAKEANSNPFFLKRVQQCQNEAGRIPNFITVDFYKEGDTFAVVDALNKVNTKE